MPLHAKPVQPAEYGRLENPTRRPKRTACHLGRTYAGREGHTSAGSVGGDFGAGERGGVGRNGERVRGVDVDAPLNRVMRRGAVSREYRWTVRDRTCD